MRHCKAQLPTEGDEKAPHLAWGSNASSDFLRSTLLGQQQFDVFGGEVADEAVLPSDDGVGEVALSLLQLQNFFLDGVTGDEAVRKDLTRLPDAVGAVDCLGLDGGVPPGIEDEDIISSGEV